MTGTCNDLMFIDQRAQEINDGNLQGVFMVIDQRIPFGTLWFNVQRSTSFEDN